MSMKDTYTEETDELISDLSEDQLKPAVKKAFSTPFVKVILRLIPALLIVTAIGMFVTGIMKYDELQSKKQELERQVEEVEYEIDELEYLIESPVDYDYIVRVAREKLGLHLPDEIVYYNDIND